MTEQEKVMQIVAYVLDGHNVSETAQYFKVGRPKIISMLDEVRIKEGKFYSRYLSELIERSLLNTISEDRTEAGQISRREEVLSEEEAIGSIFDIIFEGATTRELGVKYNCSHTSIVNAIKKLNCPKINEIIGEARQLKIKYRNNPMYHYLIFKWLFNSDVVSTISDSKTIAILSQIYELAIDNYQFKRRGSEELWKR